MSLLLVNDFTNSKLKELKCDSTGKLMVDHVDVSALASESSLNSLNGKVTACDTGSISGTVAVSAVAGSVACTHSSLPLPSGAATESSLSALNGKVTACDTSSISGSVSVSGNVACTHASLPLPSGAATESSLSSIDGKISACNTSSIGGTVAVSSVSGSVACTHASLPLPSGAATESSLSTVAGAVVGGVMQVSAGSVSASSSQVFGTGNGTVSIASGATSKSSAFDANGYKCISVFGNSSNLNDTELDVEISHDNSNWFTYNQQYVSVDFANGDFGHTFDLGARYVRLSRSNTSGSSESIKAYISGK